MKGCIPLLVLGIGLHTVSAATNTLLYYYTGTSGIPNFPEFMTVGIVNGHQIDHYDSITKRAIQKAEWISGAVDPDYWKRNTQTYAANEPSFKANIDILKSRFNQTEGVHIVQNMYGCEWDDESGATEGFNQHGYDGEDFVAFDQKTKTWIAPTPQAVITKHKWDRDIAYNEQEKHYLTQTCIEWLKKYVDYGKSTLQRTVPPLVSLLQKTPSSPVTCHATGFYPSGVMVFWQKDGQDQHEDVEYGETLHNVDGTFQKSVHLTVTPEEWNNNKYQCVVQVTGINEDFIKVLTESEIQTNWGKTNRVRPSVFLLQKTPSSPVTCHATGFYPSGVMVLWQKDGQDQHEDVEHGETLPNDDGTFQKSSHLTVTPEEWKNNEYRCVVQVTGIKEDVIKVLTEAETNWEDPTINFVPIIGVVVALLLVIAVVVVGVVIWKKKSKKGFVQTSTSDTDSDNSGKGAPKI